MTNYYSLKKERDNRRWCIEKAEALLEKQGIAPITIDLLVAEAKKMEAFVFGGGNMQENIKDLKDVLSVLSNAAL